MAELEEKKKALMAAASTSTESSTKKRKASAKSTSSSTAEAATTSRKRNNSGRAKSTSSTASTNMEVIDLSSSPSPKKPSPKNTRTLPPRGGMQRKNAFRKWQNEDDESSDDEEEGLYTETQVEVFQEKEKAEKDKEIYKKNKFVEIKPSIDFLDKHKNDLLIPLDDEDGTCPPQLARIENVNYKHSILVLEYTDGEGGYVTDKDGKALYDDEREFEEVDNVVHDTCASCHKQGGKFICVRIFLLL